MAEKALSDNTNLPPRPRPESQHSSDATGQSKNSKIIRHIRLPSGISKKSQEPKEKKCDITKTKRQDQSHETDTSSVPAGRSPGGNSHGRAGRSVRPKEKMQSTTKIQSTTRKTDTGKPVSCKGESTLHNKRDHGGKQRGDTRGRHCSKKTSQPAHDGASRAVKDQQNSKREKQSYSSGQKDKLSNFQPISSKFLNDVLLMEPAEAAFQLGSLKGSFAKGIDETIMDTKRQCLFWNVLAHIVENDGAASTVIMILNLVVRSRLFNRHLVGHLVTLRKAAKQSRKNECLGLVPVLITVFEAMISRIPSHSSDIKVPVFLMSDLVDSLNGEVTQNIKGSVASLLQSIESLQAEKELIRQKQRHSSSKPPPDDFRQHSILPTYEELKASYKPFLRPHIVKGVYPDVVHYLDVQFRLMKEDFLQPLRNGLDTYLYNRHARPEDRMKVQDVRVYENVKLVRPMTDRSGVSYKMSFQRIPRVRWEISKRLIFGSLVLLSEDDFKTYIPATVANSEARQLARGLVDIRPIDVGISSLVNKTFIMLESSAFFEAYRHVLVSLQQVIPDHFPMTKHIVDLDPNIQPPPYLAQLGNPAFDISNLITQEQNSQHTGDTPFPISLLNDNAWDAVKKTHLNKSQFAAVKTALTQELSLIQGPPGTGKTYIGLKIVETLLKNKSSWSSEETGPILLVCYTNHALDQFLLGILQFLDNGIIRVGGQSKCEELEEHNLKEVIRQTRFKRHKNSQYIRRRAGNIRQETLVAKQALDGIQTRRQMSTQGIIRETEFRRFQVMSDKHYSSMMRMRNMGHADSWILEWLIPYDVSASDLFQSPDEHSKYSDRVIEANEDHMQDVETLEQTIDVENERDMIEAQRIFDDDLEADTPNENTLNNIESPLAVYFDDVMDSDDIIRNVKIFLRQKISMKMSMNMNQASTIRDVWQLDFHQRWALYHYWLEKYVAILEAEIPVYQNDYIQLCAELRETNDHEKCLALQQATVIGMTTTRAAKERDVLHRVKPKIIIVEEAAEVLESHIITSLHTSCNQLILIGDHQQLRPKPNVYRLATKYHLDVSMFERLVKNGFPFKKLKQQHRMRPEISSLMRNHFYPELEDHESVCTYGNVKGVEKNVFFLAHKEEEAHVPETMSHYNLHEVDFIVALCRYFLEQDYKPQQITILTAYTGQLLKFKEKMDRATFEGVRVASVDNYQGEENDIILLSFVRSSTNGKIGFLNISNRVCVSLSRAKKGLYCIGDFTLYSDKCDLWRGIYSDLADRCLIGSKMTLECSNHPQTKTEVSRAADFEKVPNGGCGVPCDTLLKCSHVCTMLCHPKDPLHEMYKCPEPCNRTCEKGHPCRDVCGTKCPPCKTKMEKELFCGHLMTLACSTDPTSAAIKCHVEVEKTKLPCHHTHVLQCYQDIDTYACTTIVDRILHCGHTKIEKCGEHGSCSVIVSKVLPCGHEKEIECSRSKQSDVVCTKIIPKILPCYHVKELECNVKPEKAHCVKVVTKTRESCRHVVTEKCSTESKCKDIVQKRMPCGHLKNMECSEDVEDAFCEEKCEKMLQCGHKCNGLCGDVCSSTCDQLITRSDWPCGHTVTTKCSNQPDSCKIRCGTKLACGHICQGTCGKCMGGRYHVPCQARCNRTLLCGHQCTLLCVSPCLPCPQRCENLCEHQSCNHPCGEVCPPCTKRCNWTCPHHSCRMLCCELCSRPPCNEPCPKMLLKCGHPCPGLCGETCPQLCRTCDKEQLLEASPGIHDIEAARFMQLEDCGHVFEVNNLDEELGLNRPNTANSKITLMKCPKCRTPLRHSRRYGNAIKKTKIHVMHVKKKLEAKIKQILAEKSELQRRMNHTLTRRNLEPFKVGQQLIGRWLNVHQVVRLEHEPAMNRLQLVRTLLELHRILRKGPEERKDNLPSRKTRRGRQGSNNRESTWGKHIIEVDEQLGILGRAVLGDPTSFSYQQARDLQHEMRKAIYSVLLLIQLQQDRQDIQLLEDSFKILRTTPYIRTADLEKIRSVLENHYKTTGGKWPDNIQEVHVEISVTFAQERWYRCPKSHTCMVADGQPTLHGIECEVCLRSKAREIQRPSTESVQGSPLRRTTTTCAAPNQRLTGDQIRRMAIEVPNCGIQRGPGEKPYNYMRSVQNTTNKDNESVKQSLSDGGQEKTKRNQRNRNKHRHSNRKVHSQNNVDGHDFSKGPGVSNKGACGTQTVSNAKIKKPSLPKSGETTKTYPRAVDGPEVMSNNKGKEKGKESDIPGKTSKSSKRDVKGDSGPSARGKGVGRRRRRGGRKGDVGGGEGAEDVGNGSSSRGVEGSGDNGIGGNGKDAIGEKVERGKKGGGKGGRREEGRQREGGRMRGRRSRVKGNDDRQVEKEA